MSLKAEAGVIKCSNRKWPQQPRCSGLKTPLPRGSEGSGFAHVQTLALQQDAQHQMQARQGIKSLQGSEFLNVQTIGLLQDLTSSSIKCNLHRSFFEHNQKEFFNVDKRATSGNKTTFIPSQQQTNQTTKLR